MDCCSLSLFQSLISLIILYMIVKLVEYILDSRKWARWKDTPKDVVILHCFPRATTIPNPSPFVLKVQTYLRMANIQHKIDTKDFMGRKGKTPWITFNGQHFEDSQKIVEFLDKKFDKNLDSKFTDEQLALAATIRIMLEEHAFWRLALERYVFGQSIYKIARFRKQTFNHGIGRHSQTEIMELVTKDLRITSKLLANKKFILGNEPCIDDCAIFGMLAQVVWGLPDSPYEKLLNSELTNLKEYCVRMKEKYYPDWDKCLAL